jgi:hypothetical protein
VTRARALAAVQILLTATIISLCVWWLLVDTGRV